MPLDENRPSGYEAVTPTINRGLRSIDANIPGVSAGRQRLPSVSELIGKDHHAYVPRGAPTRFDGMPADMGKLGTPLYARDGSATVRGATNLFWAPPYNALREPAKPTAPPREEDVEYFPQQTPALVTTRHDQLSTTPRNSRRRLDSDIVTPSTVPAQRPVALRSSPFFGDRSTSRELLTHLGNNERATEAVRKPTWLWQPSEVFGEDRKPAGLPAATLKPHKAPKTKTGHAKKQVKKNASSSSSATLAEEWAPEASTPSQQPHNGSQTSSSRSTPGVQWTPTPAEALRELSGRDVNGISREQRNRWAVDFVSDRGIRLDGVAPPAVYPTHYPDAYMSGGLPPDKNDGFKPRVSSNPWDYKDPGESESNIRHSFHQTALATLQQAWDADRTPSRDDRTRLAAWLGYPMKQVTIWYQNRRQETKKKQLAEAAGTVSVTETPCRGASQQNGGPSSTPARTPAKGFSNPRKNGTFDPETGKMRPIRPDIIAETSEATKDTIRAIFTGQLRPEEYFKRYPALDPINFSNPLQSTHPTIIAAPQSSFPTTFMRRPLERSASGSLEDIMNERDANIGKHGVREKRDRPGITNLADLISSSPSSRHEDGSPRSAKTGSTVRGSPDRFMLGSPRWGKDLISKTDSWPGLDLFAYKNPAHTAHRSAMTDLRISRSIGNAENGSPLPERRKRKRSGGSDLGRNGDLPAPPRGLHASNSLPSMPMPSDLPVSRKAISERMKISSLRDSASDGDEQDVPVSSPARAARAAATIMLGFSQRSTYGSGSSE